MAEKIPSIDIGDSKKGLQKEDGQQKKEVLLNVLTPHVFSPRVSTNPNVRPVLLFLGPPCSSSSEKTPTTVSPSLTPQLRFNTPIMRPPDQQQQLGLEHSQCKTVPPTSSSTWHIAGQSKKAQEEDNKPETSQGSKRKKSSSKRKVFRAKRPVPSSLPSSESPPDSPKHPTTEELEPQITKRQQISIASRISMVLQQNESLLEYYSVGERSTKASIPTKNPAPKKPKPAQSTPAANPKPVAQNKVPPLDTTSAVSSSKIENRHVTFEPVGLVPPLVLRNSPLTADQDVSNAATISSTTMPSTATVPSQDIPGTIALVSTSQKPSEALKDTKKGSADAIPAQSSTEAKKDNSPSSESVSETHTPDADAPMVNSEDTEGPQTRSQESKQSADPSLGSPVIAAPKVAVVTPKATNEPARPAAKPKYPPRKTTIRSGHCAVRGCPTFYKSWKQASKDRLNKRQYAFPTNRHEASVWKTLCGRPSKSFDMQRAFVCADHFTMEDRHNARCRVMGLHELALPGGCRCYYLAEGARPSLKLPQDNPAIRSYLARDARASRRSQKMFLNQKRIETSKKVNKKEQTAKDWNCGDYCDHAMDQEYEEELDLEMISGPCEDGELFSESDQESQVSPSDILDTTSFAQEMFEPAVQLQDLCRVCSTTLVTSSSLAIFGEKGRQLNLQDLLRSCLGVEVLEDDVLPSMVCHPCLSVLLQVSQLRDTARASETKFNEIVQQQSLFEGSSKNTNADDKCPSPTSEPTKAQSVPIVFTSSSSSSEGDDWKMDLDLSSVYSSEQELTSTEEESSNDDNCSEVSDDGFQREFTLKTLKLLEPTCFNDALHFNKKVMFTVTEPLQDEQVMIGDARMFLEEPDEEVPGLKSLSSSDVRTYLHKFELTKIKYEKALEALKKYQCKACMEKFRSKQMLASHFHERHSLTSWSFQCLVCDRIFKLRAEVENHLSQQHPEKLRKNKSLMDLMKRISPYKCEECNKYFSTHSYRQSHKILNHNHQPSPLEIS